MPTCARCAHPLTMHTGAAGSACACLKCPSFVYAEGDKPPPDPWEALRHVTLDQLVTSTKLRGSTTLVTGWSTPEGWPYGIVCFVAKPGNEAVMDLYKGFLADLAKLTPKVQEEQGYPEGQRPEDGPRHHVGPSTWIAKKEAEPEGTTHPCDQWRADSCMCKGACSCHWTVG